MKYIVRICKSWSGDLMKKFPGSRWITMNGSPVLIRDGADGKSTVVFSAIPALEHYTYEKKTEVEKDVEKDVEVEKVSKMKDVERAKELRKQKILDNNSLKGEFVKTLQEATGIDFSALTAKRKKTGNKPIDELQEVIDGLTEKEKDKVKETIEHIATEKATNGVLQETLGSTYADIYGSSALKTGIKEVDDKLENLLLTPEQALEILNSSNQLLEQQRDLNDAYKTAMTKPESYIEKITKIKGLGVDNVFEPSNVINDAVERILQEKSVQDRVQNNMDFYAAKDKYNSKESVKIQNEGATEAFNSILQLSGIGLKLPNELVKVLGFNNVAKIVSSQMSGESKLALKDFIEGKQSSTIQSVLDKSNQTLQNIKDLSNKAENGSIYDANIGLLKARAVREMARNLSVVAGSLQASAAVYNSGGKGKDISLDVKNEDLNNVLAVLKANKIDAENIFVSNTSDGKKIVIQQSEFSNLLKKQRAAVGRDEFVKKAKNGELIESNWRPNGATSNAMPSQQEGIKWALHQKRSILDFGAGLGKTYTYMGIVAELKSKGELENSFALVNVPSRLRLEFYKDKNKYFPNLNMLNLDDVNKDLSFAKRKEMFPNVDPVKLKSATSQELKKYALDAAKAGKYDFVLTGHDTVKDVNTTKLIADAKPKAFILDEAHEAISSSGDETQGSQRYQTVKNLAENSEYFTAGTGTLIKNNVGELGKLISLADPNMVDNPTAYAKKWSARINKSGTLFQDQTLNNFRQTYDNIVLSRKSDVSYVDKKTGERKKPELLENTIKVDLHPKQMEQYRAIDKQYQQERANKGKYGVMDNETGMFLKSGDSIIASDKKPKLKELGYKSKDYSVVEMGGQDAATRREILQKRNLYAGANNAKIDKIVENVKSNPNEKHIIYYDTSTTKYSKAALLDSLKKAGLKSDQIATIDGSVSIGDKRNKQVSDFQNNPNTKVMILNSAGATGLNLQAGDKIHVLARPNTFAEQQQLAARAYRKGREKDVMVNYYDSNTSFDQRKVNNVESKKRLTSALGEYVENPTFEKLLQNAK